MGQNEVKGRILEFYDCDHVVITGGEPMLQQEALVPLLKELKEERDFFFEIETNGTILPKQELVGLIDQWNVSPKVSNSGNSTSAREIPECYEFFRSLPNAYFKLVVDDESDLCEILDIVGKYRLPQEKIILMPESTTADSLREKSTWLAEFCRDNGYRFSTRLQIVLYGNKRGV